MTFVNIAMLVGLAGTAIPVLIHLMGRRQPPRIEFPAVRFLMQNLDVQRRRLNVQRWALLLMRMALIALVVLALAQPRVFGRFGAQWISIGGLTFFAAFAALLAWLAWRGRRGTVLAVTLLLAAVLGFSGSGVWAARLLGAPVGPVRHAPAEAAVALVLDNSVRTLRRIDDQTVAQKVQETALWLLDEFPPGSRFAIFDRTSRPTTFSLDVDAARRTVEAAEPVAVEEPLDRRIEAAIRLVRTSELEYRNVYVITDLTVAGFDSAGAQSLRSILEEEPKVALQFIDVGKNDDANWRVENPQLPAQPWAAGVAPQIMVDVLGPANKPGAETQVELLIFDASNQLPVMKAGHVELPNLTPADRQTARVGENQQLVLNLPPLDPGTYRGWIRADAGDELAIDNQVPWLLEVAPPPEILIVSDEAVESRAMSRVLADPDSPANEFAVTVVTNEALTKTNLTKFSAIIWLDPANISGPLLSWAQNGGKLFVALGPRWDSSETASKLPFKTLRQWRVPSPGSYLEVVQPDYPALANLSGLAVPWPQYAVNIYWQLELGEGVMVPLRVAGTGHPLLVDLPLGNGQLILLTTPLPGLIEGSREWNQLLSGGDAWPMWLLTRQLMDQLSRPDVGNINVTVGAPIQLPRRSGDPERYQLFTPKDQAAAIDAAGDSIVPGAALDPGLYWLRSGNVNRGYAVSLKPGQTNLQRLTPTVIDGWLGNQNYSIAADRSEVKWAEGAGAGSQPLYAQAMIGAVLIWLLEHTLASRFYRNR